MPATTAVTSPDPRTESWRSLPWSPHHHQPGTGRHLGHCDAPNCNSHATRTIRVTRNSLVVRSHARCDTHTPPRGHTRTGNRSPDPQRQLVYRAEECYFTLARDQHRATLPVSVGDGQDFVAQVLRTDWWTINGDEPGPITVAEGPRRSTTRSGAAEPGLITISRGAGTWTLVHELAHHAAGFAGEPHGPIFARRLLDLHTLTHGATVARLLREAFDTLNVHYHRNGRR